MNEKEKYNIEPEGEDEGLQEKIAQREAGEKVSEFERAYGAKLADYAESEGLYFGIGEGWAIDLKKGKITCDPKFFLEHDYSGAESMWAAMHEIEHFRRMMEDLKTSDDIFKHIGRSKRLHSLYNSIEDILMNNTVESRRPAYRETRIWLYENKLFKDKNYTKMPEHIQFIYALLRESMIAHEKCEVSEKVRKEIEKIKREDMDVVGLISSPGEFPPEEWFKAVKEYIEPIYDNLFTDDVKQEKEKKGFDKDRQPTGSEAEEWFQEYYDSLDEKLPNSLSPEDLKKAIGDALKNKGDEEITPEEREERGFKAAHGVSREDYIKYQENYLAKIEPYISQMRELFERIISKREEVFLRLKELSESGVILHPGLAAQAYIDKISGISDSRTELTYKKEVIDENKPNDFELTLVCDLSGSMEGEKLHEQQLAATLVLEALQEFEDKLRREREEQKLSLHVYSEVRGFSDEDYEIKPLSDNLTIKECVETARNLNKTIGGTADNTTLSQIFNSLDEKKLEAMEKGDLKKVVIVLSDGESGAKTEVRNLLNKLRNSKVIVIGVGMTKDAESIKGTYAPEAQVCYDISNLPKVLGELLEKYLNEI